jgi:hypothetical protein
VLEVERERAHTPEGLYRELIKANAALPADRRRCLAELERVIDQEPAERWVYAKAGGWREDEAAFLLGDELIGGGADVRVFPPGGLGPRARRAIVEGHHRRGIRDCRPAAGRTGPRHRAGDHAGWPQPHANLRNGGNAAQHREWRQYRPVRGELYKLDGARPRHQESHAAE